MISRETTPWAFGIEDIEAAARRIAPFLAPTPLRSYPLLDARLDAHVLVKHEHHQPTGAFKVRNGLNVLAGLSRAERRNGVVAASMGNYGAGLAWAGQRLGVPITICVPHGVNPDKLAAIEALGAELIISGSDFDESLEEQARLVQTRGLYEAHGANHPLVPPGAGTITLEIVQQLQAMNERLDAMLIGVGGGSQAVGAMTVLRERCPEVAVYGVQAEGAPTTHDAWHRGKPAVGDPPTTFCEGLKTRQTYELTFPMLREGLVDFVLVSDAELAGAMRLIWETTHNMVEPAGAAGIAALPELAERLRGKTVAVVFSGANVDLETLRQVIDGGPRCR